MASLLDAWSAVATVDPTGNAASSAGDNRMKIAMRLFRFGSEITGTTFTIGTEAFDYFRSVYFAVSGQPDIQIDAWLWNEVSIAAQVGDVIAFNDGETVGTQIWSFATFQDVIQQDPVVTDEDTGIVTSFALTTTSVAIDQIVGAVISEALARLPLGYDTLTERAVSVANFAAGIASGAGGDGTTTLSNDLFAADEMCGMTIVLNDVVVDNAMMARQMHEGHLLER